MSRVAIVGATGVVGERLISILQQRDFPATDLKLFASPRSLGKKIKFKAREIVCEVLQTGCFDQTQFVFFDASDAISKEWVPQAVKSGAWVIDNSAVFRMDDQVPLMVPEINGHLVSQAPKKIISGPNCSTAGLVMALAPLHQKFGLKRVVVSTYQSVSGAGREAMNELDSQIKARWDKQEIRSRNFVHPIAYECIPQIGSFKGSPWTGEEQKIMEETKKILGLPQLKISATAVRVPTQVGHGESVYAEFEKAPELAQVRQALNEFNGVRVLDEPSNSIYPLCALAAGGDEVLVGRIRRDPDIEQGLSFWVVSDNLRKGAALNAVQIGERLIEKNGI